MHFLLIVEPPAEFAAWMEHYLAPAPTPTSPEAVRGFAMFQGFPCGGCHTIDGTTAHGTVGPNLTHFSSRQILGAGVLPNTPANLAKWLHNPQAIKPGSYMPNFRLAPAEVRALTDYLEMLK
jgi:cytochrome c oxidase subunit 2